MLTQEGLMEGFEVNESQLIENKEKEIKRSMPTTITEYQCRRVAVKDICETDDADKCSTDPLTDKKVSIIIPVRNEEKYIAQCLDSVISNDYPKNLLEVFVIDGMSNDRTQEIILGYTKRFAYIKSLQNPKHSVPFAMNIGIRSSINSYIIRLDAHAEYPEDYIRKLIFWHEKLNADNVGGIWSTEVYNKSFKSNAIKLVLSDKLGVGNALFRVGVKEIKEVDTVPFGCYRRDVFDRYGLYDERLTRNQDIELNKRIRNKGGKIYLVPDISCKYYAREDYRSLAKNNFSNGLWNLLTSYYTRSVKSMSLRHFIPLLFVLSLIIPVAIGFFYFPVIYVSIISMFSYFIAVTFRSFKLKSKETTIFDLIAAFVVLHVSYGTGSMFGLTKISFEWFKRRLATPHAE